MRISLPAAPVVLVLVTLFGGGWYLGDQRSAQKLARITEERDIAMSTAKTAVEVSEKALEHSLSNAGTLEICLGKLGLKPAVITPTRHRPPSLWDSPDYLQLNALAPTQP